MKKIGFSLDEIRKHMKSSNNRQQPYSPQKTAYSNRQADKRAQSHKKQTSSQMYANGKRQDIQYTGEPHTA